MTAPTTPVPFSVVTKFVLDATQIRNLINIVVTGTAHTLCPHPILLQEYMREITRSCDENTQGILNNMTYSLYNGKATTADSASWVLDLCDLSNVDIKASFDVYLAHPFNEWKDQRTVNNCN